MDSFTAFAMGEANRGKTRKVFDWHKAARLIRDAQPSSVSAGLAGDWEFTGGTIYADGKPVAKDDTYTYLASTWATPEIDIDDDVHDCYVMEDETNGWDANTFWPETALEILNAKEAATQ